MKTVVVVLKPEAARALRAAAQAGARSQIEPGIAALPELARLMTQLGLALVPTHPDATHEMLLPYYSVRVDADDQAESVASRLRASRHVDSAYVQPPASPA